MDPGTATAVASGLGLMGNKGAQKAANRAAKQGRALEARATRVWDKLFANAEEAERQGQFDAERRIASLERDTANYESRDLGNLGGAMRVAGYKPGDSEIGTRFDAVKMKYRRFFDATRDTIRQNVFNEKQAAYAVPLGYLQPGLQGAQNRQNIALGSMSDPSGFAMALAPFLKDKAQPGGFKLPSGKTLYRPTGSPFYSEF